MQILKGFVVFRFSGKELAISHEFKSFQQANKKCILVDNIIYLNSQRLLGIYLLTAPNSSTVLLQVHVQVVIKLIILKDFQQPIPSST